jgi:hypothetical protein
LARPAIGPDGNAILRIAASGSVAARPRCRIGQLYWAMPGHEDGSGGPGVEDIALISIEPSLPNKTQHFQYVGYCRC